MEKFTEFLNNITQEANNYIKNNKYDIRDSKNKIKDALHFRFSYSNADKSATKQKILSSISFKNNLRDNLDDTKKNIKINRSSMYRKENNLPVDLYEHLYDYIQKFYKDQFNINDLVIIVDGVYSNTNINHNGESELSMSLGFFHSNESIPYDIYFTGAGKKNNEIICLKEYICNNLDYFKGKTIICDRAYFCIDFFNFLDEHDINFIIRIGDECNLALEVDTKKGAKNYKDWVKFKSNKHMRIVSNVTNITKKLTENILESKEINLDNKVFIATNLNNLYTNSDILNMYSSRWNIEEFFKQLKRNFKFQYLDEHYDNSYKKNIYCSLIIILMKQIMINYYKKTTNLKSKTIISSKKLEEIIIDYSIDENTLISGIVTDLLDKIFNSIMTNDIMTNFLESYKNIQQNKKNRSFERKSKRPFTKWYVKKYHELYKLKVKSLNMIINDLNKNNDANAIQLKKEYKKVKKELYKKYREDIELLKNENK